MSTTRSPHSFLPSRLIVAAVVAILSTAPAALAEEVFVEFGTSMRYVANEADPGVPGIAWTVPGFDDSAWTVGEYGVGYENGTGAENLLRTVTPTVISVYSRVTFDVANPAAITSLWFGVDYDDGVVAWLNGVEILHSPEMPAGDPDWDTETDSQHESSNAVNPDYRPLIDVSALIPTLQPTGNVLAVGVWNDRPSSSDLVLVPQLLANPAINPLERGPYLQMATPTSIRVRWRTPGPADSVVRYGLRPDDLSLSRVDAAAVTEHEVTLSGLTPDTQYFYAVGSTIETLAGEDFGHRFRTPPLPGTDKPLRLWVIGDAGTANADQAAVRNAYLNDRVGCDTDVWLMLGDNAYTDGTDLEYQQAVFEMYPSLLRTAAVWPTLGNHDARSASSASESGVYYDIFSLPRAAEAGGIASGTEAYYSFDHGNVHFICLDSEDTSRSPTGAMADWLRLDIADTTQDWVIAYFHHPPYTKGSHDSDTESHHIDMRETFLPILEANGVDLVLGGHSHSYERSYLLDDHTGDSTTFNLAVHAVDPGDGRIDGDGAYTKPAGGPVAHAGAVYTVAGSSGKTTSASLDHPAMVTSLLELGSVAIDISGDRLDARFLDDSGAERDGYTILKGSEIRPLGPLALAATAVSATEIDVTWTDRANDEDGYVLERSADRIDWTTVAAVGANVTSHRDSGLLPATTYWYRVHAFNGFGDSACSNQDDATTACAAPGTVGNTLLMVKAGGPILAYWTDLTEATSYNLYEDTIKSGSFGTLTTSGPGGTLGLPVTWPAGPRLFYRIAGIGPCGEGPR